MDRQSARLPGEESSSDPTSSRLIEFELAVSLCRSTVPILALGPFPRPTLSPLILVPVSLLAFDFRNPKLHKHGIFYSTRLSRLSSALHIGLDQSTFRQSIWVVSFSILGLRFLF